MAETPMDIIARHLDLAIESGDGAPDAVTLAVIINDELREKFTITSNEEIVTPTLKDNEVEICIRITGNPSLWYMGTNKQPYRLDDETVPGSVGFPSGREAQIALALTDLSASRLHEVTK